jgi:hypothetical protein
MQTSTTRQQFREVLAGLASKTLTKIPALNGRVEKACKLVLAGDVALHPDGTALVNSLTDPTRAYQVTGSPATCQCQDYDHAPEHLCAHRLSVGFLRKVQELLPPAPESTPGVHPVSTTPLPEAPASCNVYVMLGGHKVQVTLRDTDEHRMLVRLEELLQRSPAAPGSTQASAASPQAPTDGLPPCPYGHGFLRKSTKREGYYCPHKWDDGTYCKGRA